MDKNSISSLISAGNAILGVELGSTRIKAVLLGKDRKAVASGSHSWENRLENGIWTYTLNDVKTGIQDAYAKLCAEVFENYGVKITELKAVGFSAMMHGYLAFDENDEQLAQFRTWRNTMTAQAAEELTKLFSFNIPQRWSIAHLYQAMLNGEEHLSKLKHLTTLAGYVHYMLTGKRVLGVGEASGMFPIDSKTNDYNENMVKLFDKKIAEKGFSWKTRDILPKVLCAGECGGKLTESGALYLDPTGTLKAGAILCPPEGDAGTGMVATNSIKERTGNVSAGTSIFAMAVLENDLRGVYPEIDMVTTPTGKPVAMVHCNNCTGDLDAWVKLFKQYNELMGIEISTPELYDRLYETALKADNDCGGLVSFNYFSGEPVTGLTEGRPMFMRTPNAAFSLSNFMRAHLFTTVSTLKIGMDILFEKENVRLDKLYGHGGLFKTPVVGQKLAAGALGVPVAVMETAGEGGAWGIALLAEFAANKKDGQSLESYLEDDVFADAAGSVIEPDETDVKGFEEYLKLFKAGLSAQKDASVNLRSL